jgi:hypothetical protein
VTRFKINAQHAKVWIQARSSMHPLSIEASGLEGWIDLTFIEDKLDLSEPVEGRLGLPVDKLTCGSRLEDVELRRRIDARHHPRIEGVLSGISSTTVDHKYEVSGDLTFNGVTRSYKDEMWIEPVDQWLIRLDGWTRFDLREFEVRPPRVLFVKFEPFVDVRVEMLAYDPDRWEDEHGNRVYE